MMMSGCYETFFSGNQTWLAGKSSINCQWGAFNRTIIYQWGISIATFDYWRRVILKIDFFSGLMKANYMLVDNELKFYDFPKNAQVVYTFGMKLVKPSDLLFEPLCHFCFRWGLAIRVFVTKPNAKPSPMFTKPHPNWGFLICRVLHYCISTEYFVFPNLAVFKIPAWFDFIVTAFYPGIILAYTKLISWEALLVDD